MALVSACAPSANPHWSVMCVLTPSFISWDVDVGIVDGLQKVEGCGMAFECVHREHVACIDSISEELKASRGRWHDVWSDCANFRDAEYSIFCSSERTSEWVVSNVHIFE